jgi:large subunit ribosomal protein L30
VPETGKATAAKRTSAQKRQGRQQRQKGKRAAGQKTLRVKQVKSGIGHAETYRRTLRALGLHHHQDEIAVADNPSVRGMLRKVRHLIQVREEA